MAEENAVKRLQEKGIECLFTNTYLQNRGSFRENRERFGREFQEEDFARRYPLMNLLGYLSFKVNDEAAEAENMFKEILHEKPDNLIALLNLKFIYDHLGLSTEAQNYEQRLADLLKGSCSFVLEARAKYELAEILTAVDAHKQAGGEIKVKRFFEDSLCCKGVDALEKLEWEFGYAFFYFMVDSLKGENCTDYFVKSMKHFYNILSTIPPKPQKSDEQTSRMLKRMKDMVPKAWCFMSTLMSRWNRAEDYGCLCKIMELQCLVCHYEFTWRDCLREAETTCSARNKHVVFRRIGVVLLRLKKMEEAKKYLEEALELKKEGYGFSLMGRWNLQMYTDGEGEVYLDNAVRYFEMAKENGCDLWHCYRDLAKCMLYKNDKINALSLCEKAKTCGGKYDRGLLYLQADVYDKFEEPEKATEMRQQGDMVKRSDLGWVYCHEDSSAIGHITKRLENLKDCQFSVQFFDRVITSGKSLSKLSETCTRILVYCSDTFCRSSCMAKDTLGSILECRKNQGKLNTIIRVVDQGAHTDDGSPFLLDINETLVYDEDTFYDNLKKLAEHDQS